MSAATGDWREEDVGGAEGVGVGAGTTTIDPAVTGFFKFVIGCLTLSFIAMMLALAVPDGRAADYQIKRLRADVDRLETQVKALTERIDKSLSQGSAKP